MTTPFLNRAATEGTDNRINVPTGDGIANFSRSGNSGTWPSERSGWTAAREAGHLILLADNYSTNIMGKHGASPVEQNIKNLIRANNCECK